MKDWSSLNPTHFRNFCLSFVGIAPRALMKALFNMQWQLSEELEEDVTPDENKCILVMDRVFNTYDEGGRGPARATKMVEEIFFTVKEMLDEAASSSKPK